MALDRIHQFFDFIAFFSITYICSFKDYSNIIQLDKSIVIFPLSTLKCLKFIEKI